jgi:hypothetical protein
MLARIPVYSDENNLHFISVFVEESDGTFKRTQSEPLRLLRDNFDGISITQGSVVATKFDKNPRRWETPTVSFHYGRPQSIFQFLREKVAINKYYVFCKPNLAGRITQLSLHELKLKPSISQQKLKLLKEKYVEALDLWSPEQYKKHLLQKKAVGGGIKARQQRLLEKKKQAFEKLKESRRPVHEARQQVEDFIRYESPGMTNPVNSAFQQKPRKSPVAIFKPRKARKAGAVADHDRDNPVYQRFTFTID